MNISEKLTAIAQNETAVYLSGRMDEYDMFWDALQDYGRRTAYGNMFVSAWNDDNFRPKYDIRPTKMNYCFAGTTELTDLSAALERCGVLLDTSSCTDLGECFAYSRLTKIPKVSAVSCNSLNHIFRNCQQLVHIENLILKDDGSQTFNYYAFYNCSALEHLRIEGCIGTNFDIHWSSRLSAESIDSIVQHTSDTKEFTLTMPLCASNTYDAKYGVGAWEALVASKPGITFAYA